MKEERVYQLLFELLDNRLECAEAEAEQIIADVPVEKCPAEQAFAVQGPAKHRWPQIAAVFVLVMFLAGGAGYFLHAVLTSSEDPESETSKAAHTTGTTTITEDSNVYPLVFLKLPDPCEVTYVKESGLIVYTITTPTCSARMEQALDTAERNDEFNRLRQGLVDGLPTVRREQLYEAEGYVDLTCANYCVWWCTGRYLVRLEAEGNTEEAIAIAKWIKEDR